MFPGFALEQIDVGPVRLRVRHGGSGPPVVLLHGHPRTHATWHRVAPLLADRFTVICPDLRGYGGSSKPPAGPDHAGYAKRAMAADIVGLLDALGHDRAAVVGHDRGCYVAMRTALDHPGRVSRLGVLDGVSIGEARTTGPASARTGRPTRPTGPPGGASAARCCSASPPATTWRSCTATRPRSGASGPRTCGWHPSTPGTTWPRRRRSSSPRCWARSWRPRAVSRPG
ncbi:alpha/beta hydrolase [Micromonospora purpureochromogenes]|uniref:alpha/beta fold hydrolase n=1 Tax=Micromonospora purpureochromogenes TaxID=47872 RepID=UPI00332F41C7